MIRKIIIELTIDWEDYEDVADELIVEDTGVFQSMKEGVSYRIIKSKTTNNDTTTRND